MAKNKTPKTRKDTSSKARKTTKIKRKVKRQIVPRTRNLKTMTESEYFGKIRSSLRSCFRFWKPALKALELSSRPYTGKNSRQKKEYQCNECENWFSRRSVEIDHIEECGKLSSYEDIIIFIQRLTREEPEAYQILCKECHKTKTKKYHDNKKAA